MATLLRPRCGVEHIEWISRHRRHDYLRGCRAGKTSQLPFLGARHRNHCCGLPPSGAIKATNRGRKWCRKDANYCYGVWQAVSLSKRPGKESEETVLLGIALAITSEGGNTNRFIEDRSLNSRVDSSDAISGTARHSLRWEWIVAVWQAVYLSERLGKESEETVRAFDCALSEVFPINFKRCQNFDGLMH